MFVALALFTAREIWRAFDERAGQARAAAVFDLVATRTAVRPTDAPGAIAWLRRAIERAGFFDRSLIDPGDRAPESLGQLAAQLHNSPHGGGAEPVLTPPTTASVAGPVRSQHLLRVDNRTLVVTRRQALDADPGSRRFLMEAGRVVAATDAFLRLAPQDKGASSGERSPRIVRIYAIHEDGTLVSLPWADHPGDAAEANLLNVELATLSTRANLPAFAPEDFFFRSAMDSYSGFYLDLGGRGLVSTLIAPLSLSGVATHSVLAMDLAFDIDWARLAASLEPPIRGAAVYIVPGTSTSWSALGQQLPDVTAAELRHAVMDAAVSVGPAGLDTEAPMRHAVVANGAVAAFRVSDRQWLLAWFPQSAPAFPLNAVAALTALLALLLAGFEVNRRRALREQRTAEREFQEKQNLLNTMQVPLVVVDPNSDAIVSANRAADAMGFAAGRRFADLVWPDERARAHYQRMQIASPEPRRAYGVPVAVPGENGQMERRYAVVRSVAVTAPIEALHADERHRLGVLVVLDESSDLQLLLEDTDAAAHRDERRRLAGLLSHGVDTLARVLEYSLSRGQDPAFAVWLAGYLERRVGVTAWLLDHWDAQPPLPRESIIDAAQARATIDRFQSVLALAASERDLRQRLHWGNGTLSSPVPRPLDVSLDWPGDVVVTCPVHGGFGLFLNELVVNAVRHGLPGTVPGVTIACDRARGEVVCEIRNATDKPAPDLAHLDPYGGLSIVRAMARLFGWQDFGIQVAGGYFIVTWAMPSGTQSRTAD